MILLAVSRLFSGLLRSVQDGRDPLAVDGRLLRRDEYCRRPQVHPSGRLHDPWRCRLHVLHQLALGACRVRRGTAGRVPQQTLRRLRRGEHLSIVSVFITFFPIP